MAKTEVSYPELKITVQDGGRVVATPLKGTGADDGQIDNDPLLLETLKSIRNWLNQGQLNVKLEEELKPVGKLLHRLLLERGGPGVRELIRTELTEAKHKFKRTCIQLEFQPGVSELGTLPWEFLYSPEVNCFWAFISTLVLTRYTKGYSDREPLSPEDLPLRMLIIVSRKGGGTVGANDSIKAIEKFATDNPSRIVLVDTLEDMSFFPLQARLKKLAEEGKRPHLVHFIGHGQYNKETGQGEAALPDAEGTGTQWLNQDQFSRLFTDSNCVPRLVFLQICEGARLGKSDLVESFEGLAPALIKMNVQVVVAMQFRILMENATTMCRIFYDELTKGKSVGEAVQTTRLNTVIDDPVAAGTPVLYMYGYDGAIVSAPSAPQPTAGGRGLAGGYSATGESSTIKPESGPPEGTRRVTPGPSSSLPAGGGLATEALAQIMQSAAQGSTSIPPVTGGLSPEQDKVVSAGCRELKDMHDKGDISKEKYSALYRELLLNVRPAVRGKETGYDISTLLADRLEFETDIHLKNVLNRMLDEAGKLP